MYILCILSINHLSINRSISQEMYYKELAHVIIKAVKYQDLSFANWRLKKAEEVIGLCLRT